LPTVQSMFLLRIVFCLYHDLPRGCCSCLHQHTVSVTIQHHSFLSYMTRAWGMPVSFVHNLFLHTLWKVGSYMFPSPSNGSLLILSLFLSLTTTLLVEETLMNFGYTYSPNLIHQGHLLSLKFRLQMVTGIQHRQTVMRSPMDQNYHKSISKRSKTIQPVIKSKCYSLGQSSILIKSILASSHWAIHLTS
jgi:hypothetical protein